MQPNWWDCGVYLLCYVDQFFEAPDEHAAKFLAREEAMHDIPYKEIRGKRRDIRQLILKLKAEQDKSLSTAQSGSRVNSDTDNRSNLLPGCSSTETLKAVCADSDDPIEVVNPRPVAIAGLDNVKVQKTRSSARVTPPTAPVSSSRNSTPRIGSSLNPESQLKDDSDISGSCQGPLFEVEMPVLPHTTSAYIQVSASPRSPSPTSDANIPVHPTVTAPKSNKFEPTNRLKMHSEPVDLLAKSPGTREDRKYRSATPTKKEVIDLEDVQPQTETSKSSSSSTIVTNGTTRHTFFAECEAVAGQSSQ